MSISIDQSTILVTGANRGLGKAFVEAFVEAGATVYAGARDPESVTTPGVARRTPRRDGPRLRRRRGR